MILIGQYDSSFVRRVGIALTLYGMAFEHRPWSVFSDAGKIRSINPLVRVPVLVLEDGEALVETNAILDHLDGLVGEDRVLAPRREPARRRALKISALASGLADLAVSLFYEKFLHSQASPILVERRSGQLLGAIAALEADRAAREGPFWFGERLLHADIAVAASLRHVCESHPDLADLQSFPALADHCARLEATPVFRAISQAFVPPA